MREVTVKVYRFKELSEEVQKKLIDKERKYTQESRWWLYDDIIVTAKDYMRERLSGVIGYCPQDFYYHDGNNSYIGGFVDHADFQRWLTETLGWENDAITMAIAENIYPYNWEERFPLDTDSRDWEHVDRSLIIAFMEERHVSSCYDEEELGRWTEHFAGAVERRWAIIQNSLNAFFREIELATYREVEEGVEYIESDEYIIEELSILEFFGNGEVYVEF